MISTDMRTYDYYTYGDADKYAQPQLSSTPSGQVKMVINIASQSIQDNILYKNAQYVGLTRDEVNDTYVIKYGDERLKVLYVNPKGRLKQVFMTAI